MKTRISLQRGGIGPRNFGRQGRYGGGAEIGRRSLRDRRILAGGLRPGLDLMARRETTFKLKRSMPLKAPQAPRAALVLLLPCGHPVKSTWHGGEQPHPNNTGDAPPLAKGGRDERHGGPISSTSAAPGGGMVPTKGKNEGF